LERQEILKVLHSERFVDLAAAEVWATLLDEGVYLGSQSTFYRLLRAASGTGKRRRQATHPASQDPPIAANLPGNQESRHPLLVRLRRFQPLSRHPQADLAQVLQNVPDRPRRVAPLHQPSPVALDVRSQLTGLSSWI